MRHGLALVVLALLVSHSSAISAQTIDPHKLFEERCSRCHGGHAGDFARKSLILSPEGKVAGKKSRVPVADFLATHFGKLSAAEITAVAEMFSLQLRSAGLYQQKCRTCHDSAKVLARSELALRDGRLVGRYSAHDISEFLDRHGRLTPAKIETVHAMLVWQLRVAGD